MKGRSSTRSTHNSRRQTQRPKTAFQILCRQLFALLRLIHHLEVMSISKTQGLPSAFLKKVAGLSRFLRPAHPNPNLNLKGELTQLGQTWAFSVTDRLILHYEAEINRLEISVSKSMATNPQHFENATQVALYWAKSRLGRKWSSKARNRFLAKTLEIFNTYNSQGPTTPGHTTHHTTPPQSQGTYNTQPNQSSSPGMTLTFTSVSLPSPSCSDDSLNTIVSLGGGGRPPKIHGWTYVQRKNIQIEEVHLPLACQQDIMQWQSPF